MNNVNIENLIEIGALIRERRQSANENQFDFGNKSGLSRELLGKIESGNAINIGYRKMTYLFSDSNIFLHVKGIDIENPTLTDISELIKKKRSELSMSFRSLSDASGVNHSTIYEIENYNGKNIAYTKVIKVMKALNIELKINIPAIEAKQKSKLNQDAVSGDSFIDRFTLMSP